MPRGQTPHTMLFAIITVLIYGVAVYFDTVNSVR